MTSLDASIEESSKIRELVKLFGTAKTADDLSMGQLRTSYKGG